MANHGKAYRWGTNKRFEWNENTHACQIINVQETTEEVAASTSLSTASAFFCGVPESKLLKIGVPQELVARVMAIQNLNDLDKMESILPVDAYENIFNIMDGENIDAVISKSKRGRRMAKPTSCLATITNDALWNSPTTMLSSASSTKVWTNGRFSSILHNGSWLRPTTKERRRLVGGAGAGKTIAAIHRLRHLCEEPRANVLFTTFTKTLSENLVEAIDKLGVAKQKYTLMNIDRVLHDVAERYKVKEGYKVLDYFDYDDEPSMALWREILENEVTEFDEKFLYDEYINVILFYGNKDVQQYMLQSRVGRTKALSRKQRIEIWNLVEKYVALKQKRKVVDRLELFYETTNYLNDNNIRPYTNVIADEFQDFSNPELKFLRALVA